MRKSSYKPTMIGSGKTQRFALARDIAPTQSREMFTRWLIGGIGAWTLMREVGIELADVEEVLRHESYREMQRREERAYQAGRRSALPVRYGLETIQLRAAA